MKTFICLYLFFFVGFIAHGKTNLDTLAIDVKNKKCAIIKQNGSFIFTSQNPNNEEIKLVIETNNGEPALTILNSEILAKKIPDFQAIKEVRLLIKSTQETIKCTLQSDTNKTFGSTTKTPENKAKIPSYNQYFIEDVYTLSKNVDSKEAWDKFVEVYNIDPNNIKTNEYLKILYNDAKLVGVKESNNIAESQAGNLSLESLLPANIWIDALGTFIAKRFREELTTEYINKFRSFLKDNEETVPIKLLPTTYKLLITGNPFSFKNYINSMRDSFKEDVKTMPENTLEVIESKAQDANVKLAAGLSKEVLIELKDRHTLATIITNMEDWKVLEGDEKEKKVLRFISILNQNIAIGAEYPESKNLKDYFKNPLFIKIFMGMFIEKEQSALIGLGFYNDLRSGSNHLKNIQQYISQISALQEDIKSIKKNLDNAGTTARDTAIRQLYYETFSGSVQLLNNSFKLVKLFKPNEVTSGFYEKFDNITQNVTTISRLIYEKSYGLAISQVVTTLVEQNVIKTESIQLQSKIVEYGLFINNVLNAKDSEALVKVLEDVALPVGSFRIKRVSPFSVSLNSFGGGIVNYNNITLAKNESNKVWSISPNAPVGIALNWGGKGKFKNNSATSLSLFLPLIDVGAVFAMRLGETDSIASLPKLAWKNFFAPGAYFSWGIRNSPVSLSLGFQNGPSILEFKKDNQNTLQSVEALRAIRWGASVSVDIPLFNLFSRTAKEMIFPVSDIHKQKEKIKAKKAELEKLRKGKRATLQKMS